MRIGILTLPLHTNYGGILQAYALQTVLERMGHEVVIIDEPIRRQVTSWKKIIKRIIKKIIGRKTKLLWEKYFYESYPIMSKNIQPFIDKYLHRTVVDSPSLFDDGSFDAVVVGSDQIWRPIYYSHIENAYLEFAKDWKDLKRIAYAPSFGTDEWEYSEEQTNHCASLLKGFDAVSVREESGVRLCQEHFGVTPFLVLDPTMLLSKEEYDNLIEASDTSIPDGELLNYVLDKSEAIAQLISFISKEKDMTTFAVNGKPFLEGSKVEDCIQPSIESWLRGFRDAKFVITDSFHACVFSLIFNKPFCVVGNKMRGMARFYSLLKMFGQEFRLIKNIEDYQSKKESIAKAPNVNLLDSKQRQFSLNFLNLSLNIAM